jgi:hypothetical protein
MWHELERVKRNDSLQIVGWKQQHQQQQEGEDTEN